MMAVRMPFNQCVNEEVKSLLSGNAVSQQYKHASTAEYSTKYCSISTGTTSTYVLVSLYCCENTVATLLIVPFNSINHKVVLIIYYDYD